ncbi:hypothetical protein P8452_19355 [Trifolium repens]|nr:hypothetical protein P8452_19355 [Trifolium repens]
MSLMSGQFILDSRNLCDRVLGWTGIGGIKKESFFSHYTRWGEKRTKAVWSTTRSQCHHLIGYIWVGGKKRVPLAETLSLYQSKKGRIVPSMSSLNLGWWKLGRVSKKISVMEFLLNKLGIWAAHMTDDHEISSFLNRVPDLSHDYMTKDQQRLHLTLIKWKQ